MSYFKKNKVKININIEVVKPGRYNDELGFNNDEFIANLSEVFKIRVDPNININDIREFIIAAINAIEDEVPDSG